MMFGYYETIRYFSSFEMWRRTKFPWLSACGYWLGDNRIFLESIVRKLKCKVIVMAAMILKEFRRKTVRTTTPIQRNKPGGRK